MKTTGMNIDINVNYKEMLLFTITKHFLLLLLHEVANMNMIKILHLLLQKKGTRNTCRNKLNKYLNINIYSHNMKRV